MKVKFLALLAIAVLIASQTTAFACGMKGEGHEEGEAVTEKAAS